MSEKLQNNVFRKINELEERICDLERMVETAEKETQKAFQIAQTHLMRVKNGERLSDDFVLNRRSYNDLSPDKAWRLYQDKDLDFILIDVSLKAHKPEKEIKESIKIPFEELGVRHAEIVNKAASIWVISEDGTRSILACELLNRKGFHNVNNVSGGYKFWPGTRGIVEKEESQNQDELKSA